MVAMVLTTMLGLLLVSAFGQVAGTYQQIEGRAETYREGRAALHFIAGELSQLVDVQALASTNAPGFTTPPPRLEIDIASASTNGSLGFLTRLPFAAQPTNEAPSDICLVGYFLSKPAFGGGQSLYRRLIPSKSAFERLTSGGSSFFQSGDFNPDDSEPLADNVLDFRVTLKDADLNPPATVSNAVYVELFLRVIGSRVANRYFASDTPEDVRERLEQKEAKDFTFRWKL